MYIILEAHHRFDNDAVADLWSLIRRVYAIHPELTTAIHRPEIAHIAHIALAAWQRRDEYLRQQRDFDLQSEYESPQWILDLRRKFDVPHGNESFATDPAEQRPAIDASQLLPLDFDFDSIDWSFWDEMQLDLAL